MLDGVSLFSRNRRATKCCILVLFSWDNDLADLQIEMPLTETFQFQIMARMLGCIKAPRFRTVVSFQSQLRLYLAQAMLVGTCSFIFRVWIVDVLLRQVVVYSKLAAIGENCF